VGIYEKELERRLGSEATELIQSLLKKEFEIADGMIRKNFSNFSAWHYRSKLLPKITERDELGYLIPIGKIKEDLELLKHAFFTDPKDQSPWNYHEWLVSLLQPIQVLSCIHEGQDIQIGLSSKTSLELSGFKILILNGSGEALGFIVETQKKDLSALWKI